MKQINESILLTKEGHEKLKAELCQLKEKEERLVNKIEEVSQPGEFGEDVLVSQLKQELDLVTDRIDALKEALSSVKLISGNQSNGSAALGHEITLRSDSAVRKFKLVCHLEADPVKNKISDQSPLGQALVGKKVGDSIEFDAPAGKITYKVVEIA